MSKAQVRLSSRLRFLLWPGEFTRLQRRFTPKRETLRKQNGITRVPEPLSFNSRIPSARENHCRNRFSRQLRLVEFSRLGNLSVEAVTTQDGCRGGTAAPNNRSLFPVFVQ